MSQKKWGKDEFWGLGFEWDPQWILNDRQKKLQETLISLCEQEMRANAVESDKKLLYPRKNFQLLAKHGFLGLLVPKSLGRHGREPCQRRHGGGNHRPLRLPLDRHVLHHASRRRRCGSVPPSRFEAHSGHHAAHRQGLPRRHAVIFRSRNRIAFLVSDLLGRRGNARRLEGAQKGLMDHLGRFRRLVHRPDDLAGIQRQLLRPLLFPRHGQRGEGRSLELGWARPARQPVGPDRGRHDASEGPPRRPRRRRRLLQRRMRRSLLPPVLLRLLERHLHGAHRHRQAPHHQQDPQGRRHAGRRLSDHPGLCRRGDHRHQLLAAPSIS